MGFTGFGTGAIAFFKELEANNSREWWLANKKRYESDIREPLELLMIELAGEFGEAKVFRPNRDTRFSKDKSPYKTNAAAVIWTPPASGVYLSLSLDGLHVAGGGYRMERDQLARYREAVDDPKSGRALETIVASLRKTKASVGGHGELKTAPRGYTTDHPRIDLLRMDGITGGWVYPPTTKWIYTKQAATKTAERWRLLQPLHDWLAKHVGATTVTRG